MLLTELLKLVPPSTKVWVYIYEEGKMELFGTSKLFLDMLEDAEDEGIVEYFIPASNAIKIYLKIIEE